VILVAAVGLVITLGTLRLLGGDKTQSEGEKAPPTEETAVDPSSLLAPPVEGGTQEELHVSPSALVEESSIPQSPPALPSGPLEFAVLQTREPLLTALDSSTDNIASTAALVRELGKWSRKVQSLSANNEPLTVTVMAFGDRDKSTRDGCLNNEKVAQARATRFAELLKLLLDETTVYAAWNACEPPPGISDPASPEARRLVLLYGRQEVECDCSTVNWETL
jgi:hypothetical protein